MEISEYTPEENSGKSSSIPLRDAQCRKNCCLPNGTLKVCVCGFCVGYFVVSDESIKFASVIMQYETMNFKNRNNNSHGFKIDSPDNNDRQHGRNATSEPLSPERARFQHNLKIVRMMWRIFGIMVGVVLLFFILIYNGIIGYMPEVEELKNPHDQFASVIYTADGEEMGRFFKDTGNRLYADYDEISQHVVDALVSTEDERFEEHSGIDVKALGRAIIKTVILRQKSAGGGSTITQQLAKQLYTPPTKNILSRAFQKPIEWMIAIKLERYYSKEEIIKMYLNQFDFLYNAVGIKSAAQVYFNKEARNLRVEEAAMLVGLVKNPTYYNPMRYPERATERRNVVLDQMVKAGKLTQAECDSLSALPLGLNFHRMDHKEGIAPYFREELRRVLTAKKPQRSDYPSWDQQRFVDDSVAWATNPLFGWIQKNPKADGTYYDLYNDGLRIYTTIDSRMQHYAEEAVEEHMSQLQKRFNAEKGRMPYSSNPAELSSAGRDKLIRNAMRQSERYRVAKAAGKSDSEIEREFHTPFDMTLFSYEGPVEKTMTPYDSILYVKSFLRTGMMSMDPRTGYVKAYVGGPDYRFFQYDMVSRGRRQIGSTIKPILYTLAMEDDYTPCSMFSNTPPVFKLSNGQTWTPRGGRGGGMIDLRRALTTSNNYVSARVLNEVGPTRLVQLMHRMGITNQLPAVISLSLGPCEVSVREMVGAYSAFANKGMRSEPIYVTAITDNKGNVLAHFSPIQTEVISEKAYYRILSMLLNVVDHGTGARLRGGPYNLTAEIGGKTGTTNFNADGWFMGFTPELVTGVWVGGDERYIHFNSTADGQGAEMALPIFGRFMKKIYSDRNLQMSQEAKFTFPPDVNLCGGLYGDGDGDGEDQQVENVSVDDVFD